MTTFEVTLLLLLGLNALAIFMVADRVTDLRKDVGEIWKRMKRLD